MSIIPRRFYLDDFFDDFVPSKNDMKCDIYEKEGKHHIEIDVPGFKKEDIKGMQISTFHSFGLRVIKEYYDFFGLDRTFTIIDESDSISLIKKI